MQMVQKEEENTQIVLANYGILHERLISNQKSEIKFLKNSTFQRTLLSKAKLRFSAEN